MKLISAFFILLLLSSCASQNQIEYVNVPIKCNAKMPLKPLKSKNVNDFDYAKATLIYLRKCESTLKQCLKVEE